MNRESKHGSEYHILIRTTFQLSGVGSKGKKAPQIISMCINHEMAMYKIAQNVHDLASNQGLIPIYISNSTAIRITASCKRSLNG